MSQPIVINIGAIPNDGTGDPLRTAFNDTNLNFANVFASGPVGSNIQIANNSILTLNTNGNLVLNPNGIGVVQANAHVVPDQTRIRNLGSANLLWNTTYTQYLNTTYATIGTANIGNIGTLTIDVGNLHLLGGTNGYVLQTDGTGNLTWTAQTGGTGNGTPGGANTQVQYNDAGAFGGTAGFTFDNASNVLSVPGNVSAGNVLTSAQVIANGEIQSGTGFFTGGYLSVNGNTDLHDTTVTGNLIINNSGPEWSFNTDGSLSLPAGNLVGLGNVIGPGNISYPFGPGPVLLANTAGNNSAYFSLTAVANATGVLGYMGMAQFGSNSSTGLVETTDGTGNSYSWYFQNDGTTAFPAYTVPNVDGANAQVLTTYGNGTLSWSNVASSGSAAGNAGDIQINVAGNIGADSTLRYVDNGGEMTLYADYLNAPGIFTSNIYAGDGTPSNITLTTSYGNATWTFGTDGTLTVPLAPSGPSNQIKYGMGNLVSWLDGQWTIGEYNGNAYGTQGIRVSPGIEGNVEVILPSDATANTNALQLNNYVGNVQVTANYNYWTFGADGTTEFPNSTIKTANNQPLSVQTPSSGNAYTTMYQNSSHWEVYAEDDATGTHSAWAWMFAELPTVDTPQVFIENQPGSDGVARRWTFDAVGNLTLPTNTSSINYANGQPYGSGGTTISNKIVNGTSSANIEFPGGNLAVGINLQPVTGAWIDTYGNIVVNDSGDTAGESVVIDAGGNVYVTGAVFNTEFNNDQAYIRKLDSNGTVLWQKGLPNAVDGSDLSSGETLAIDGSGNIYWLSLLYGNTSGIPLVAKLDPSTGEAVWTTMIIGATYAYDMTVNAAGQVFVVTNNQGRITSLDTNGAVLWSFDPSNSGTSIVDTGTFVIIGYGQGTVAAYDYSGNLLWVNQVFNINQEVWGLAWDGTDWYASTVNGYITKISGADNSTILWQRFINRDGTSGNIFNTWIEYSGGYIYATGTGNDGGGYAFITVKIDASTGDLNWARSLEANNAGQWYWYGHHDISVLGDYYAITGYARPANSNSDKQVLARLPVDGSLAGSTVGPYRYVDVPALTVDTVSVAGTGYATPGQPAAVTTTSDTTLNTLVAPYPEVNILSPFTTGPLWTFDATGNLSIPGGGAVWTLGTAGTAGITANILDPFTVNLGLDYVGNSATLAAGNLVTIQTATGTKSWTFDSAGELTLPTGGHLGYAGKGWTGLDGGNGAPVSVTSFYANGFYAGCVSAYPDGNVGVTTYTGSSNYSWNFDNTGALNLPTATGGPFGGFAGVVQTANAYPTLLAYGLGGHGGPELDWTNSDDPANTFSSSDTVRNTLYLNGEAGLYVGFNENGNVGPYTGHFQVDTLGNVQIPAQNVGASTPNGTPGEATYLRGTRKAINGVYTGATNPFAVVLPFDGSATVVYATEPNVYINSAKVTFAVQGTGVGANWEQFDVVFTPDYVNAGEILWVVSNRIKANLNVADTIVTVAYGTNSQIEISLQLPFGQNGWASFDAIEFGLMVD